MIVPSSSWTPMDRSEKSIMCDVDCSLMLESFSYLFARLVLRALELYPCLIMAEEEGRETARVQAVGLEGQDGSKDPPPGAVEHAPTSAEIVLDAGAADQSAQGGTSAKKRSLEIVPEMLADQRDSKRRAEQELAYQTLKDCVVELRIATNAIEKMAKMAQHQQKTRDAAAEQEDALRGQLESIGHHLRATGGGINYYASQLGDFKAEVKEHLKQFRKLLEKVDWDWCQGPKARTPMWEVVNTAVTQLASHFEASKQFNEKLLGGQNELVVLMKQMMSLF